MGWFSGRKAQSAPRTRQSQPDATPQQVHTIAAGIVERGEAPDPTQNPDVMLEVGKRYAARSPLRIGTSDLALGATDNSLDMAVSWWRSAVDAGSVEAMLQLGRVYLGWGGHRAQVMELYERAANAGNVIAMVKLGTVLLSDSDDVPFRRSLGQDISAEDLAHAEVATAGALKWFGKAAAEGNSDAMFNLGLMAERRSDRSAAIGWYTKAAQAAHHAAQDRLDYLMGRRAPGHHPIQLD
ncbi:tetratricopeptide repeat protein [Cellulomonas sp. HD19AZ1]|uniref:tetratricopeptide repeat protein n=1 Tax=Cellulomonas sp. HD19AZ1 TaxID=2559593 RepID=UPI00143079E9|nr:SEL1-like repeat protein [Cellulomonas sp. HD19AZ1]